MRTPLFVLLFASVMAVSVPAGGELAVVDTIHLAHPDGNAIAPVAVCVDEYDDIYYAVSQQSGHLAIISGAFGQIETVIHLGGQPRGICLNELQNYVYVADYSRDQVLVFDVYLQAVTDTIPTEGGPWGLCVAEDEFGDDYLFVACYQEDVVRVYNVEGSAPQMIRNISTPDEPLGICYSSTLDRVFVACHGAEQVTVIDAATLDVLTSVDVGGRIRAVDINESSGLVYASCYDDGIIEVEDGNSSQWHDRILLDGYPCGLAVDPLNNRIWVADSEGQAVWAVDENTMAVVDTIAVGKKPRDIAMNASYGKALVVNYQSNDLTILDINAMTVTSNLLLGSWPTRLLVAQTAERLYVSDTSSDRVLAVDLNTHQVAGTAIVENDPMGVAACGDRLYVTNSQSNQISVVDTGTFQTVGTIQVGEMPWSADADPQRDRVYVTTFEPGDLWIIDAAADTVVRSLEIGSRIEDLAADVSGGYLYICSPEETVIQMVDTEAETLAASITVGTKTMAICLDQSAGAVYAVSPDEDKIVIIDTYSGEMTDEVPVGQGPRDICAISADHRVYVVNGRGESISVVDGVSLEASDPVQIGAVPYGIAAWEVERRIYVSCSSMGAIFVLEDEATGVDQAGSSGILPATYGLGQNYPNPFNARTRIPVTVPGQHAQQITLNIFNVQGQKVRQLDLPDFPDGRGAVIWDGRDERRQEVASGLYLCRLQAGDTDGSAPGRAIKMVLLR